MHTHTRFGLGLAALLGMAGVVAGNSQTRLGCDTDTNGDGHVNVNDVLDLVGLWGQPGPDVNGDGVVGVAELLMCLEEFGGPCHPFHDNMIVMFELDAGVAIITGTGLADHPMGPFDGSTGCYNPNTPSAQNDTWRIPLNPVVGDTSGIVYFDQLGKVSVALNGVGIYNPFDNGGIDAPSTICMDEYNGHPSPDGRYHYHQASDWAYSTVGHSGIFGYGIDGYPIYGPFEDSGVFASDLTGSMALDECNGHTDEVRGYHYHATSFELNPDGFPWVQGCWHGDPETSNLQGGGGGGPCDDGCGAHMIPPPVCMCMQNNPEYAYCCSEPNWDAHCWEGSAACGGPSGP